jgi:exodeoxyribonuclease VII large subunit
MTRTLDGHRLALAGLVRGLPRPMQIVEEARQRLDDRSERLANALTVGLDRRRDRLGAASARLVAPRVRIDQARRQLDGETRALASAVRGQLRQETARLAHASALLESFSYQRVLERGFVLVNDPTGRTVTTATAVLPSQPLMLRFHDGRVDVVAVAEPPPAPKPSRRRPRDRDDGQGTLW